MTLVGDGDWIKRYIGGILGEKPLLPLCVDCVDGIGERRRRGMLASSSGRRARASGVR